MQDLLNDKTEDNQPHQFGSSRSFFWPNVGKNIDLDGPVQLNITFYINGFQPMRDRGMII